MFPFDDVIMDINAGFQMYNLLTRIRWFFIQAVNRVNCHYPFPLIKDSHKHYLCDTITWGYHQSLISSDACMSRQTDSRLVRGTVLCLVRWHYLNGLFMVGRTLRKKTAVKYWSKYIFFHEDIFENVCKISTILSLRLTCRLLWLGIGISPLHHCICITA